MGEFFERFNLERMKANVELLSGDYHMDPRKKDLLEMKEAVQKGITTWEELGITGEDINWYLENWPKDESNLW